MLRKLEVGLAWGWLMCIPTQLGKHWWPAWSRVWGVRVDWLSPTLYVLDIIWFAWLCLVCGNQMFCRKTIKIKKHLVSWPTLFFCLLVVVNIGLAARWQVALYRWLRLGQLGITVWVLTSSQIELKRILKRIIPVWLVVEGGLGLMQVVSGKTLQGIWYWLGERSLGYTTPEVAKWSVMGVETIRAYGTFSHPNSMAGFLGLALIGYWGLASKDSSTEKRPFGWGMSVVSLVGLLGIVLTGSRSVWLVLTGLTLVFITLHKPTKAFGRIPKVFRVCTVLLPGVLLLGGMYRGYLGGWDGASWQKRVDLFVAGGSLIIKSPVVGVGLGNFVVKLAEKGWTEAGWQPVHNTPLLGFIEAGAILWLVGIFSIWFGLVKKIQKHLDTTQLDYFKYAWMFVLLTGMVDHYWLTLPQNMWLATLFLFLV